MKKLAFRCVNLLSEGICILILLLFLSNLAGFKTYVVQSGSMEPAIQTGSLCIVNTHADYDAVQEGDIIAFQIETGNLATHRVVRVTEEGLETQGDNTDSSDGISTTEENFRGETLFSIPKLGYLVAWVTTPRGMIVSVTVILALILLTQILKPGKGLVPDGDQT